MLTPRGRLVLAIAGVLYLIAWAFGSEPLYPVAVGLILAVALAWGWVRWLDRPFDLRRRPAKAEPLEGADLAIDFELLPDARFFPASLVLVDRIARLGEREVELHRAGRVLRGRATVPTVARGRYPIEGTWAVLEDPFGLERKEVQLASGGALLVYPRLVQLDRLFSESGARGREGRRLLLRRPAGFDFHSVREYEEGESLRRVHWATTARRARLMVKELEDSPRDEIAVLLDAAEGVIAGAPPDSSFDMQVRAAGSILRAYARRGRRAVLVVNSLLGETQTVRAEAADWRRALEVLAAAEPDGRTPAAALLAEEASPAARALELAVVTAQLPPVLVDRLLQRAYARRAVSLVYVDAASFAAPPRVALEPGLLRLQAAGIPVAVLRRGDDLAAQLGGGAAREVASA